MVKSISINQTEIIDGILSLYTENKQIDADITYSKGVFYKDGVIKEPTLKFDISPERDDVVQADCRNLPLAAKSLKTIMFDPPFLATTGKSLAKEDDNNIISKRFGVYPSETILHQMYVDTLRECWRVLKKDGILIFKCQDKVSSGRQYLSHVFIINNAVSIGFYPEDLFVLEAKSRLTPKWQVDNQKHARKFHCYFLVLRKTNKSCPLFEFGMPALVS